MSYSYQSEKDWLFTDDGQRMFLKIRDNVQQLLRKAGAVQMGKAIAGITGSSWNMLACVDRMVELGELREITNGDTAGQHRVFVDARPE